MKKSKFIHVRQKDSTAPVRLTIYILLTLASASCAIAPSILPQLGNIDDRILTAITVVGILALAYFVFMAAYTVFRLISPKDAMIVCRNGYYDFITSPGKNLFISWKSISSARIFGTKNAPVLGIFLKDPEKLIAELDDDIAEEVRANLDIGLPPLMYREDEIKEPLQRVLTLYMKRIETADAVEYGRSADGEYTIPVIDEN